MARRLGYGNELALFQGESLDAGADQREWMEYRPTSRPVVGCPLEFNISGNGRHYLDLGGIRWYMALKIVQKDGSDLKWDPGPGEGKVRHTVCFENMPLQCMWRQMDMNLQEKPIAPMGKVYSHKASLDVVTSEDYLGKQGRMRKQLYKREYVAYPDDEFLKPDKDDGREPNPAVEWRWGMTALSRTVEVEGPLYLDLCQQERYLLNGVPVNIKMWPAERDFYLLSPDVAADYRVVIEEAKLLVCAVRVRDEVMRGVEETLKHSPALYPYTRSDIRTLALSKGSNNVYLEDVYQGRVPDQLIVAAVSTAGYNGSLKRSAFNYRHYDCSYLGFFVDGESVPSKPLRMNFDNSMYMDAYRSLVRDVNLGIDREEYPFGSCVYVLDVKGKEPSADRRLPIKRGHTRFEMQFAKPLPEAVTLILYGKFPACVSVDSERNVTTT